MKNLWKQTSSTASSAPMGEFVPSKDLPLVDDLSNTKPPASSPKKDEENKDMIPETVEVPETNQKGSGAITGDGKGFRIWRKSGFPEPSKS